MSTPLNQQQMKEMVEQGRFKDIPPNSRTVRLHIWMFSNGYIDLEMDRKATNRYISFMYDKPIRTPLTPELVEFMIEMDCKFYRNLKQYSTDRFYKIVGVDRYIRALLRHHPHVGSQGTI
jgi:retron-type reverse transcriptase